MIIVTVVKCYIGWLVKVPAQRSEAKIVGMQIERELKSQEQRLSDFLVIVKLL